MTRCFGGDDDQKSVLGAIDGSLGVAGVDYEEAEVEMVLKLGLMCSSYFMEDRPTMHQVAQYLNGQESMPVITQANLMISPPG